VELQVPDDPKSYFQFEGLKQISNLGCDTTKAILFGFGVDKVCAVAGLNGLLLTSKQGQTLSICRILTVKTAQ